MNYISKIICLVTLLGTLAAHSQAFAQTEINGLYQAKSYCSRGSFYQGEHYRIEADQIGIHFFRKGYVNSDFIESKGFALLVGEKEGAHLLDSGHESYVGKFLSSSQVEGFQELQYSIASAGSAPELTGEIFLSKAGNTLTIHLMKFNNPFIHQDETCVFEKITF